MTTRKEKTLNAAVAKQDREEGMNRNTYQGDPMKTSLGDTADNFSSTFYVATTNARISVESDRDYWEDNTLPNRVRLTDDSESHMLLSPAEALSVAAALQAVAVHLMETPEARAA